jgi:hypothetical protein
MMTAQLDPDALVARRYRQRASDARHRAAALPLDHASAAAWRDIAASYDKLAEISEKLARGIF